ncbi:MAG: hypothetical protein FWG30_03240 [Eubacteriaceae bacterium]|nr:hypothetical protein [Eubacteriaceae bacterium]
MVDRLGDMFKSAKDLAGGLTDAKSALDLIKGANITESQVASIAKLMLDQAKAPGTDSSIIGKLNELVESSQTEKAPQWWDSVKGWLGDANVLAKAAPLIMKIAEALSKK